MSHLAGLVDRIPAPLRGAVWMVAASACFAAMSVLVRLVSADVHPLEVVFFRNVFGVLLVLPWILRDRGRGLGTQRLGLHALRAVAALSSMLCWFTAVSLMPLAEATALNFTAPLFATLGAAVVLGEAVGARRWSAVAVGFLGAMMILRPGHGALSLPALLALASAFSISISMLTMKSLSRTESARAILFYMGLVMTPLSLPPALIVWTTPSLEAMLWMAAVAVAATLVQLALARAFALAAASAVLPLDFLRLVFAAAFGFALFGERPDLWVWIGAAVIFGSTLYTAYREARSGEGGRERDVGPP
jgi:drug/metabolite transporter (DMT)-like permease